MVTLVLLIAAIVCFAVAALGNELRQVKLVPLGLALLAAAHLPL